MKCIVRWYNSTLSDQEQVSKLREFSVEAINTIHKTFLSGELKLWCLQFGLLPCVRWPLTVYEVVISEVEKCEEVVNKAVRK